VVAFGAVWASKRSSHHERIVFQAKVDGLYQLFTIDPDGSHLRQITHLAIEHGSIPGAEQARWSPDGSKIIFDSDYGQTKTELIRVYTVKPDGSKLQAVPLDLPGFAGAPAYSPDGKLISFDWDADASPVHQQGIDIANADGTEVRRLTSLDAPNVLDQRSSWSPDGQWIVFTELRGVGQSALVKIRPDGTGRKELTPWALNANNARWSPDGTRIAFNSFNDAQAGQMANLYTLRPDGTGIVQLTSNAAGTRNAYMGSWSPDGKQIVFHLRGSAVNQLFVVDADGSGLRRLTQLPAAANPGYASWTAG
jgi:Tol biopolymer transport system component